MFCQGEDKPALWPILALPRFTSVLQSDRTVDEWISIFLLQMSPPAPHGFRVSRWPLSQQDDQVLGANPNPFQTQYWDLVSFLETDKVNKPLVNVWNLLTHESRMLGIQKRGTHGLGTPCSPHQQVWEDREQKKMGNGEWVEGTGSESLSTRCPWSNGRKAVRQVSTFQFRRRSVKEVRGDEKEAKEGASLWRRAGPQNTFLLDWRKASLNPLTLLMPKEHFWERTHDPQEAAPRETVDTESVGRQTGEAFGLWFALVCEKFVH